ncbi:transmembrane protein 71 [Varanus komodoensis]|uniref:transmembrane protein 71 n=1 Tax=Varanus komodoensis TaxID=61221 RepID=UPI001CF7D5DE|nr:transmembrane protein 71 [Varanus komodoensis]XP_044306371.1 transmembrane protein 71 [Varanus komodoensis]XP_044306372.1 transmembrane protein 71 [Varanus komodoensis]XP_044306373.1 transmembrane protein 71 [Varanus komodoensis]
MHPESEPFGLSYTNALLDHGAAYEICLSNTCTRCFLEHRRSPRLLTNGYYVLTEDSFLPDEEGNTMLSPVQTSITYKEKLVRIFRRRKKIRRSLVSLFSIGASNSWLSSTMIDAPHGEDAWLEVDGQKDTTHFYDNGTVDNTLGCSTEKAERPNPTPAKSSPSNDVIFPKSRKKRCSPSCTFPLAENEHFHETSLDSPNAFTIRKALCPMIMLSMCLVLSLSVRFILGAPLVALLPCLLLISIFMCKQFSVPVPSSNHLWDECHLLETG